MAPSPLLTPLLASLRLPHSSSYTEPIQAARHCRGLLRVKILVQQKPGDQSSVQLRLVESKSSFHFALVQSMFHESRVGEGQVGTSLVFLST